MCRIERNIRGASSFLLVATCAISAWGETSEPALIRVSSPQVAEIIVDGSDCGSTPALIEVSPGTHQVTLSIGEQHFSRVVDVSAAEVVEVRVDETTISQQNESPRRDGTDRATRYQAPQQPWARRVFLWPLVELQMLSSTGLRSFEVPINPDVDTSGRTNAAFESGAFGLLGFKLALFPLSRVRMVPLRGLGIEGSAIFDVGLLVINNRSGEEVDASFSEAGLALVYNLVVGRHDRGGMVIARLGWHRTEFYLGEVANDIVPPFTYDTFRIEAGGRIALGTRHLLVDLGLAYLATLSIGASATEAYSASGTLPSAHGGEVHLGLLHRVGRIELGLAWVGRWFRSEFVGTGQGWGQEPTTRIYRGAEGIETTGPAQDSIHQLRFSLGYRF